MMKKLLLIALFATTQAFLTPSAVAQFTKLYDLPTQHNPGRTPLISDGTYLYGMTRFDDTPNDAGVIYKIRPDGSDFSIIHQFIGSDGDGPSGALYRSGSFLYGVTSYGGSENHGTLFSINTDGSDFQVLHHFPSAQGREPSGGLVSDGSFLYGSTRRGGATGAGVIFRINFDGSGFSVLHDFVQGLGPVGGMLLDGSNLFGAHNRFTTDESYSLFRFDLNGQYLTYFFDFDFSTGSNLYGSLITDGTYLYGANTGGGSGGGGNIFKIRMDGADYQELHGYAQFNDYGGPDGEPIFDGTYLYGASDIKTSNNRGVIFRLRPDGTEYTVLHEFNGADGGTSGTGRLLLEGNSLYGVTDGGGNAGAGVVFKYSIGGAVVTIDDCIDAQELLVNETCSVIQGDVEGATQSLVGCTGNANNDVWYSFVATGNAATVEVTGSTDFDAVLEVFGGNCGSLNSLDCIDLTLEGGTESAELTALTPGVTYYVRVYDYNSDIPATTVFDICVVSPTVGIKEALVSDLFYYPNPTNGDFTIAGTKANHTIEVYNNMGQLLLRQNAQEQRTSVNLKQQAPGIYYVHVTGDTEVTRFKLIKQ